MLQSLHFDGGLSLRRRKIFWIIFSVIFVYEILPRPSRALCCYLLLQESTDVALLVSSEWIFPWLTGVRLNNCCSVFEQARVLIMTSFASLRSQSSVLSRTTLRTSMCVLVPLPPL